MLTSYGDGQVFAARTGAGPVVCLGLHGWGRDHRDLLPALAGLDGLAVDLPGFGASPEPPSVWGSADYAESLEPVLNAVAPEFVVVGHSFGGRVAMHLAIRHPDRVRGLILVASPLAPRTDRRAVPLAYRMQRRLHRWGLVPSRSFEQTRRKYGSPDYVRATPRMRDILVRVVNEDYSQLLPTIVAPVTLVWGARDEQVSLEVARRIAGAIQPTPSVVIAPDADHHAVLVSPELTQVVGEHLSRVS